MPLVTHSQFYKLKATMGNLKLLATELITTECKLRTPFIASDTNDTAVALTERFAALVSFQWQQMSLPPA